MLKVGLLSFGGGFVLVFVKIGTSCDGWQWAIAVDIRIENNLLVYLIRGVKYIHKQDWKKTAFIVETMRNKQVTTFHNWNGSRCRIISDAIIPIMTQT